MVSCHAKARMPSLPLAGLLFDTLVEGKRVPQCSVPIPCRAEVITVHAPSTLQACETHITSRRAVYCPPRPSALLTYGSNASIGVPIASLVLSR